MTAFRTRFLGIALLGGALTACGGSATRTGAEIAGGGATATAAGGTTATAAGGTTATAGAGSRGTQHWFTDANLDELFPWFVQTPGDPYPAASEDGDQSLVHVRLEGAPVEATVSTHNHIGVIGEATAVTFSAWASAPLTMLVSVRARVDDADYFGARAAGRTWPVAPVELSSERQRFTVRFADMMPSETEPPDMAAFLIGFIVERPAGPLDLWLDDVRFE